MTSVLARWPLVGPIEHVFQHLATEIVDDASDLGDALVPPDDDERCRAHPGSQGRPAFALRVSMSKRVGGAFTVR